MFLLPLVKKEAAFSQWLNRVKLGRETKLNAGRKKTESGEAMWTPAGDRHNGSLLVGHETHSKIL